VLAFKEIPGEGIEGFVEGELVKIGTCRFVCGQSDIRLETAVFVSFENDLCGWFRFRNHYRDNIYNLLTQLKKKYRISVLSGDNDAEMHNLRKWLGEDATILFHQKPEDKLAYIKDLQQVGERVIMIGDGLNDAGALKQSDAGIAVCEQTNNFTPASDAIIEAARLSSLGSLIRLCKANRVIVVSSFALSVMYNLAGLFFAVQGNLNPLIAAILMPGSSLCIFLVTFGSSNLLAKRMHL
jgi:Cu+-exporting ATPase